MKSNRDTKPVKLFACIHAANECIISNFGPTDHRSSLIPIDGIPRVFFSLEKLIEASSLPEIIRHTDLSEFIKMGYLENHRVVLDAEILHFKNSSIQFLSSTHPDFKSIPCQNFFITMRRLFRDQLRTMCLLKR